MNKISLRAVDEWEEYLIGDLFTLKNGIKYPSDIRIKGNIPLVSTTSLNNGISDYIESRNGIYSNVLSVAYSGSVGETFFHEGNVFIGETVFVLLPKFELNKYNAMFLLPIIKKNNKRYDYGRKIKGSKYLDDVIKLPTLNGSPDWEYMENYIKSLERKYIPDLNEIRKPKINKKINLRAVDEWEEYLLTDYFDMYSGKYYSKEIYGIGKTPQVSTSDYNNGIKDYMNVEGVYPSNTITIGKVGCLAYYQNKKYVASPDVTVLIEKTKFLNSYVGLFIITVINQEKKKWSYGRQIRLGDCKKLKIKLPTLNGSPDWEYMENYIKSLPYSNKI